MYDVCFPPEKSRRANVSEVDPKTAILCYGVFACLLTWGELADMLSCSGVCLERHVVNRHALLLWCLSGKNTWPNSEKITLSITPNVSSFLLSWCSVSDR